MLNSLSNISKGVKKWNLYFKRNHGTAKCTVFVERDCLFHSKEFTWLSESFSHTCAHICGLNLLGWVELNLWDTVCRHSPLNSICLDCTPPEAIIRMSICLCVCVCFMSGLCRLLGFAAAYLYSVLWNIFQTLWSTQPPIRLRLWSFIRKTDAYRWRCLDYLSLQYLRHHYVIS